MIALYCGVLILYAVKRVAKRINSINSIIADISFNLDVLKSMKIESQVPPLKLRIHSFIATPIQFYVTSPITTDLHTFYMSLEEIDSHVIDSPLGLLSLREEHPKSLEYAENETALTATFITLEEQIEQAIELGERLKIELSFLSKERLSMYIHFD
jgi:hypothetical protein